ncbi:hypothetical protein [Phenylobacterium sp. J367]|uniref:hypothetical protein n=1 Tax=Phenylobacterium sp. J367 TaxID=2898435 RepID=UPI002150B2DE|nr:hypothetical protein [Phenylobacterium sp. J367]MCR5877183.1 hypothetical protein [Phenylobacterium sp. J367]
MARKFDTSGWAEIASAIVLSVAALASAWANYQAGLWDGEQAASYSRANAYRIDATRAALEGDALTSIEAEMFGHWLDAEAQDEAPLADFYRARFPSGLKPAFNAWLAERPLANPSAAPTPFSHPAYERPGRRETARLDRLANDTFDSGQGANNISDAFQQAAAILALAMFFGGIGQVFQIPAARIGLIAVAGVTMVLGLLRLVSLPLQTLSL